VDCVRFDDKLFNVSLSISTKSMEIISLSAHFDGQSIQLDQPYNLEPNTKLLITIVPSIEERENWLCLSQEQLNRAYGQDDDYSIEAIKVANPSYAGTGVVVENADFSNMKKISEAHRQYCCN